MKTKLPILVLTLVLLTSLGLAGSFAQQVEIEPGIIDASSPLYQADVAIDNLLMNTGLQDAGDVAHERASEMYRAQERNQTQARERAQEQLNQVAQAAQGNSTGLQKAERVLEQVRQRANENARAGIDTALDNIRQAQQRGPADEIAGNKPL